MRQILAAAAATWLMLAGFAAVAQPSAEAPSPERIELARRIVKDTGGEQTVAANAKALVGPILTVMLSNIPNAPPKMIDALREAVNEAMDDYVPTAIEDAVQLYASVFDEAQLRGIVAFYESPTGEAMIAKMPELTRQIGLSSAKHLPAMEADMMRRFCAKVGCTPEQRDKLLKMQPQAG